MKLIRSDSPEVARGIASTRTLASRYLPAFLAALLPNLMILSVTLVSLMVSVRAAVWIGLPAFLAWNVWVLWRTKSPRFSWLIKARAERVYIRLAVGSGKTWREGDLPDVIEFEASEIASMSIRTVEVFLYGPKPQIVEWLMIEPARAVAESFSEQIPSFVADYRASDLSQRVCWNNQMLRLGVGWKMCRPAMRIFLKQVAREYPSIVIGPEERSELDLNGIWHGFREQPNAEQRRMLVQANRLGFGCKLPGLLSLYRFMPYKEAAAYLAEIERAQTEAECSADEATCYTRSLED